MFHINTKIIAALGGVLLIVSVGACVLFFYRVTEQRVLLQNKVSERAVAKARQSSLTELTKTLEDTKVARESLISRILSENGVVDFLTLIESIEKEQGVEIKTDSLTVEPISEVFEKLVVNISVTGSYTSVVHVLKLLEHLPYQSSLRKVSIGREDRSANVWKGMFELSVTKFKKI